MRKGEKRAAGWLPAEVEHFLFKRGNGCDISRACRAPKSRENDVNARREKGNNEGAQCYLPGRRESE